MEYVEFLRVRRAFVVYAAIVAMAMLSAAGSIAAASLGNGHGLVTITVGSDASSHQTTYQSLRTIANSMHVPLGLLLGIAGYCAVVFATVLASSLNRQNDGAEFAFVKPLSRDALALRYVANRHGRNRRGICVRAGRHRVAAPGRIARDRARQV